jgi:hypothetical protein
LADFLSPVSDWRIFFPPVSDWRIFIPPCYWLADFYSLCLQLAGFSLPPSSVWRICSVAEIGAFFFGYQS